MMTCGGSRLPAVNIISSSRFSLKLKRENDEREHRRREQGEDHRRDRDDQRVEEELAAAPRRSRPLMKLSRVRRRRRRHVAVDRPCRRTAGGPCSTAHAIGNSQTQRHADEEDVERDPLPADAPPWLTASAVPSSSACASRSSVRPPAWSGSGRSTIGHERDHQQDDGDGRTEPDQARLADAVVRDQRSTAARGRSCPG